jgi:hypothetical protein
VYISAGAKNSLFDINQFAVGRHDIEKGGKGFDDLLDRRWVD